jgi:signal peptidase II
MMLPLVVATLVFVADQLTKLWALSTLSPTRPLVIVPGLVQLILVLNPGVAFGILAGVPRQWRWIVMVFSLAALVLLCSLAARIGPEGGRLGRLAIGLVSGGAVGNLLDRWRLGAVVDFLDVHWRDYHWPAFNVADSAITVGVVLLATELAFGGQPRAGGAATAR